MKKARRYGLVYRDTPWVVIETRGNDQIVHRFHTEEEADRFIDAHSNV